jgi:hypothetical protein
LVEIKAISRETLSISGYNVIEKGLPLLATFAVPGN